MAEEEKMAEQSEASLLSIKDAARVLGVSERSVYGYIEDGSLSGFRARKVTVLRREDVLNYRRKAPGRVRVHTPPWHVPPVNNIPYLTQITVNLRAGQAEKFEQKICEIRAAGRHHLVGTTARYILRALEGDEVRIVLIWRSAVMPVEEAREAALAAFRADLADLLAWESATYKQGQVLLST